MTKSFKIHTEFSSSIEVGIDFLHVVEFKLYPESNTIVPKEAVGSGSQWLLAENIGETIGRDQSWIESINLSNKILSESEKSSLVTSFDSGSNSDTLEWFQTNYLHSGSNIANSISNYLLSGSATSTKTQKYFKKLV